MKIIAVDYGTKRIGIAVAEVAVRLAFSRPCVRGSGSMLGDAEKIAEFAKSEGASLVVVGLPLHSSGEEGEQAKISRTFGAMLIGHGLSVAFWDERFTTAAARLSLEEAPRKKRAGLVDSEAARIMLVDFLAKTDE